MNGKSLPALGDLGCDLGLQRQLYVCECFRGGMAGKVLFPLLPGLTSGVYHFLPNESVLSICLNSLQMPPPVSRGCNPCRLQWEIAHCLGRSWSSQHNCHVTQRQAETKKVKLPTKHQCIIALEQMNHFSGYIISLTKRGKKKRTDNMVKTQTET